MKGTNKRQLQLQSNDIRRSSFNSMKMLIVKKVTKLSFSLSLWLLLWSSNTLCASQQTNQAASQPAIEPQHSTNISFFSSPFFELQRGILCNGVQYTVLLVDVNNKNTLTLSLDSMEMGKNGVERAWREDMQ